MWGTGRSNVESSSNDQVQESYKPEEKNYVPLGIHGTFVRVDWDSCIADVACIDADVACIEACPVQYSSGTEVSMIYLQ